MSGYTPGTPVVLGRYIYAGVHSGDSRGRARAEFDRWLSQVMVEASRRGAVSALLRAAGEFEADVAGSSTAKRLRAAAAEIEKEEP